jgi:EmrB/QacA subfamily drug resistance transporter
MVGEYTFGGGLLKTHRTLLLGILALAQFIVILDGSIVNVALPSIMESLHFSPANLQWVMTAYILTFGGFLLLGGRAADLFGRRRVFMLGLIGFSAGSMLVGLSVNEPMMILTRALQGLAAAFMSPAALSIVLNEFREGDGRHRALGVWAASGAAGSAAGMIVGGIVTQYLGWRWDFFINVPVGVVLILLSLRYVPEHGSSVKHHDLDLTGAVLVTVGLIALVFGLSQAPDWGWGSGRTWAWLGTATAMLGLFVVNEARSKHPLVPLSIFRNLNLSGANLAQLSVTGGMMSMFFFVSLYLQHVKGYGPLQAGLAFLPFATIAGSINYIASRHMARFGYKIFMVGAPLITAAGLFVLSHVAAGGSYATVVLPGLVLMAIGGGMTFVAITIAATAGVPHHRSGLASGLLNTSQQLGGALGLAILSGIAAARSQSAVQGYQAALGMAVLFPIISSLVSLVMVRRRRRSPASDGRAAELQPMSMR